MPYEVQLRTSAAAAFRRLDPPTRGRIATALNALKSDPYGQGVSSMKGDSRYRKLRVGTYRVVFRVIDEVVDVVLIGHRREVYDAFRRLRS